MKFAICGFFWFLGEKIDLAAAVLSALGNVFFRVFQAKVGHPDTVILLG